ncbi:AraC family transcriptional regulator [Actinoplanes friuliensis]|uniref:AraC family transcriptional regulator n=1 Tax=Actinoplanes friuliensis DSM 7358 TaxID=1246995 RepID=U5VW38_9ACTN|nr:AraC family transcriptional regulator [Actinoplanes friuliensis]AGZ41198.1 AraC family transcriptional regulator [Actinoplanes friuliensis DSM 7358]
MDMITATISSARIGRANGRRVAEANAYGVRFPKFPVLGFHVMLSGEGWLITQSAPPVAIRPGDVVFTASGAEFGLARSPRALAELPPIVLADVPPPPAPVEFEFLCGGYPLEFGKVPGFLRHLPEVVTFTPDYERHPQLQALVEMLHSDYTEPGPGTGAGRSALIDLMLVHILRHLQEHGRLAGWPPNTDPGIADALHEIHTRPEHKWTVQELSEVAGMSRTAFNRRFTASVGTSPMAYLINWRLDMGAGLLRRSDVPLAGIARKVGYSTEFAFAAAFRRRYNVSPGRFRAA